MGLPAKSPQAILWGPRVGGGATFPAGRALYFTFEHDETRRKGVNNTPMSGDAHPIPRLSTPHPRKGVRGTFCKCLRESCHFCGALL